MTRIEAQAALARGQVVRLVSRYAHRPVAIHPKSPEQMGYANIRHPNDQPQTHTLVCLAHPKLFGGQIQGMPDAQTALRIATRPHLWCDGCSKVAARRKAAPHRVKRRRTVRLVRKTVDEIAHEIVDVLDFTKPMAPGADLAVLRAVINEVLRRRPCVQRGKWARVRYVLRNAIECIDEELESEDRNP